VHNEQETLLKISLSSGYPVLLFPRNEKKEKKSSFEKSVL